LLGLDKPLDLVAAGFELGLALGKYLLLLLPALGATVELLVALTQATLRDLGLGAALVGLTIQGFAQARDLSLNLLPGFELQLTAAAFDLALGLGGKASGFVQGALGLALRLDERGLSSFEAALGLTRAALGECDLAVSLARFALELTQAAANFQRLSFGACGIGGRDIQQHAQHADDGHGHVKR
jgi:hypothetical protein